MTPAQRVYLRALAAIDATTHHAASAEDVRAHVHGTRRATLGATTKALNTLIRSGHVDARRDGSTNLFWLTEQGEQAAREGRP